jgi:fructose-1,6-bisphosphatase I
MEEGVGDISTLTQRLAHSAKPLDEEHVLAKDVGEIIEALADASIKLSDLIASGELAMRPDPSGLVAQERDGASCQKALEFIVEALRPLSVYSLLIKGGSESLALNPIGRCVVIIDPFNGDGECDTDLLVGTIFSISLIDSFALRTAVGQVAAGVILYSPRTRLALTLGDGVDIFTFDRSDRTYRLTTANARLPEAAKYSIDAANHDHWDGAVRAFVREFHEDPDNGDTRNSKVRWIGSLAAETHRLLVNGGICLYPAHRQRDEGSGPIRLFDEARPIAFLIEQAGGLASNGHERILNQQVAPPMARTPLFFGSSTMVERIERLYARPESLADPSPLFGRRGLFRA